MMKNSVKLFADDTKILSNVENELLRNDLQSDLNIAAEWSKNWLLRFNTEKCVVMHYGNNNPSQNYTMENTVLGETKLEKDLGILFSSNMKWRQHIISSSTKANKILGMLKNTFAHLDEYTLKLLYTTYVRPLIEFAVPVWSPHFKGEIEMLEKIQHRATRLIPALAKFEYKKRLEILGLTTLYVRRVRGDLIQAYKILNGIEKVEFLKGFKPNAFQLSRGNGLRLEREITNCTPRHFFFANRIVNIWNKLPSNVVKAKSVNSFKAELDIWILENNIDIETAV